MDEVAKPVTVPICENGSTREASSPGGFSGDLDPQAVGEGGGARQRDPCDRHHEGRDPCDRHHDGASGLEDNINDIATAAEAWTSHDIFRHNCMQIEPHAVSSDFAALPAYEHHTRLVSDIQVHLRQYSTELHETLTKHFAALQTSLVKACTGASLSNAKHASSNIACARSNSARYRLNVPCTQSSDQTPRAPSKPSSIEISPSSASVASEMLAPEDVEKHAVPLVGSSGRSFCDVVPRQRLSAIPGAGSNSPGCTSPDDNKDRLLEMMSSKRISKRRDKRTRSSNSKHSEIEQAIEIGEAPKNASSYSSLHSMFEVRHSRVDLPSPSACVSHTSSLRESVGRNSPSFIRALQGAVNLATESFFRPSNRGVIKVASQDVQFINGRLESDANTEFANFPLLDMWETYDSIDNDPSISRQRMFKSTTRVSIDCCDEDAVVVQHRATRWMVSPGSIKRVFWDMLSAFCIAYDGLTTPLYFFELSSSTFIVTLRWFTRVFWTLDIPANLITGFHTLEGDIEMRWRIVLRRYMRTWMLADVLVVAFDWFDVFLAAGDYAAGGNAARLSKTVRIIRLVRMIRLMRVGRLPQIFERLSEYMPLQVGFFVRAAATVLKIMGIILLLAHCIACTWYAVGKDGHTSDNWIQHNSLEDRSKIYLYLTAFHWSLTQFSGTMEINPRNWRERLVAVITLVFSFMVSNIFVSSLTSTMTRYHLATSRQTKMFQELRKYLERKRISPALANRVSRNALYAYKEEQKSFEEQDIELLKLISEPLRIELHLEIHSPLLKKHPLFAHQANANPAILRKICHTAVFVQHKMPGDILFSFWEDSEDDCSLDMIFVTSGALEYKSAYTGGVQMVSHGSWLCEPKLWIEWCYFGELRATDTVQVLTLSPKLLHQIVTSHKAREFFSYAASFRKVMAYVPLDEITDIGSESQVVDVLNDAGLTMQGKPASAWAAGP